MKGETGHQSHVKLTIDRCSPRERKQHKHTLTATHYTRLRESHTHQPAPRWHTVLHLRKPRTLARTLHAVSMMWAGPGPLRIVHAAKQACIQVASRLQFSLIALLAAISRRLTV